MVAALLDELAGIVDRDAMTLLVATGTHRANTDAELRDMLGDEFAGTMRIVNHDGRDPSMLRWCGEFGDGVPVWLNRHWVDSDVRITTGFVSRTSSPASAVARRWSRPAWPAWTRC